MNILVFGGKEWDHTNAFGNTISNFFDGEVWKNDNFFNIYMRNVMPNNNVCNNYYRMTLIDMIKHHFQKEKIGQNFKINNYNQKNISSKSEQRYIDFIHKYSLNFIYLIADVFYRRKKWLNNNFKNYIQNVKPDIFFSFIADNVAILKPMLQYIKDNTDAKIVLFIADNVYESFNNKSVFRKNKLKRDFRETINMADKIFGASEELCQSYSKLFNKRINVLYKGCLFEYPVKKKLNNPIKFVYAGNLFYGRDEVLSKIGNAIEKSNNINEQKAILEIYTGATITNTLKAKLNKNGSSIIKGKKDYNEIKKIMNESDYNIHVESFEQNQIDYVKYSFSTKIIDCLQSGSSFIGIGPQEIASIKYIKKIPGAYVIDNINDINKYITKLIEQKKVIIQNAKKIRAFAVKNHDIKKVQLELRKDFIKIKNE